MSRFETRLRFSAALLSLAFAAGPLAFAPVLVASGSALAQSVDKDGNTHTTVPDNSYGSGGTKEAISRKDYHLDHEIYRDRNGGIRETYYPPDPPTRDWEGWGFYGAGAEKTENNGPTTGAIWIWPETGGMWRINVFGPAPSTPLIFSKENISRDELDKEAAFWQSQMRFWSSGAQGPVPVSGLPDYGRAETPSSPETGYAVGVRPPQQVGGLTIQCFGDIACERAQALSRGEYLYFGRRDDKGPERDDRKLYERPGLPRPELPRNSLPYEVPRGR